MPTPGLVVGRQVSFGRCLKGFSTSNRVGNVKTLIQKGRYQRRHSAKDTEIYLDLEGEVDEEEKPKVKIAVDPIKPDNLDTEEWNKYKIPHQFQGFNPQRMDLERLPRFRTNFDGQPGHLAWMGTQCAKCGLQIRKEKRTNKETSLNVYAHEGLPVDILRSCPETKLYPLLWRTRDPFIALDILGVDD